MLSTNNVKLAAVLLTTSLMGGMAYAQPESEDGFVLDFDTLECRELTLAGETEQANAALLFYGYTSGKDSRARHSPAEIEAGIQQALDYCDTHPEAPVLNGFMRDSQ